MHAGEDTLLTGQAGEEHPLATSLEMISHEEVGVGVLVVLVPFLKLPYSVPMVPQFYLICSLFNIPSYHLPPP